MTKVYKRKKELCLQENLLCKNYTPPLPGGMKFANPPYCKFHTPQGYKICKKNFNKLR